MKQSRLSSSAWHSPQSHSAFLLSSCWVCWLIGWLLCRLVGYSIQARCRDWRSPSKSDQKEPQGNKHEPKRTQKDSQIIEISLKRTSNNVNTSRSIEFICFSKKSDKILAMVPPCISCFFGARFFGRVLAILPEGISTFFQRLALPAKPFGLLAVYLLGLLVDWLVALLVGWLVTRSRHGGGIGEATG